MPWVYPNPPSDYNVAKPYHQTARGEGWMAVGAALAYQVTREKRLLDHWGKRLEWLKKISDEKGFLELPEFNTFRVWKEPKWGTMAWQAGALFYGFLAWGKKGYAKDLIMAYIRRAFEPGNGRPSYIYNLEDPKDWVSQGCSRFVLSGMGWLYRQEWISEEVKNLLVRRIEGILDGEKVPQDEQFGQLLP